MLLALNVFTHPLICIKDRKKFSWYTTTKIQSFSLGLRAFVVNLSIEETTNKRSELWTRTYGEQNLLIDTKMMIDEVMERHPETVSVFLQFGMDCYGCSMARFESVQDGADAYNVDLHLLVQALNEAARKTILLEDRT